MARSDSQTFSGFVTGDKSFKVPVYQRNYSWEEEHVDDLWDDLVEAVEMDREHYIGTFLLMEEETGKGKVHSVIDGQQRLTTLTILLFELQERLDELGEEKTARKIRGEYIARYGDQKLTLAGDDETFFRYTILEGMFDDDRSGQIEDPLTDFDTNTPSQDRLLRTKELLRENLNSGIPDTVEYKSEAAFFLDIFQQIQSLPMLEYTVDSRSEAARIFQTVNDRGKALTDLEITKSYLMHRVSLYEDGDTADAYIEKIQEHFNNIYDSIENISSGLGEDQIQRYHFIMWNPDWGAGYDYRYYQNHLYYVKEHFRSLADVDEITNYVEELARMFGRLDKLINYDEEDNDSDDDIKEHLSNLFLAGRLGNFYPLLMTAFDQYRRDKIGKAQFCALLSKIETFIVRTYIIEQKSADTARTRIYPLARKLHYNEKDEVSESVDPIDVDGVIQRLERYINDYCDDDTLKSTLGNSRVYSYYGNRKRELRLLLFAYEYHLEKQAEDIQFHPDEVVENEKDRFWIEHIWPQTPSDDFDESTKELIEEHKHRLGNLALMTQEDDIVMGNDPFAIKKGKFNGSKIRMLEEVFANDEWDVRHIEDRENRILEIIRDRWPDEYESG